MSDDLQDLWKAGGERPEVSLADLKKKSDRFARTIRWRNRRELFAGVLGAAFFLFFGLRHDGLVYRAGCVALVLGIAYVLVRLYKDGPAPKPIAPDATAAEHLAHLRAELVRQRDLLRNVAHWYILPLVPGMALLLAGSTLESMPHRFADHRGIALAVSVAFITAIFVGVILGNRWGARKLDREIDALR